MNKKLTKKQLKIYKWLLSNPGYLKKSAESLKLNSESIKDVRIALKTARKDIRMSSKAQLNYTSNHVKEFLPILKNQIKQSNGFNKDNVIFLADLHAPHILDGYLEWCKELQIKYDCGTVIMSGDIVDGGAWNYHEKNVDLPNVKDELFAAKKQLKKVFEMFPEAISLMGNHDLLISRKIKTAGLSQSFMKDFADILEAPKTWQFVHEYKKDGVLYKHGAVGDAFKAATESRMSTCQGHFHAKSFVQWSVSEKDAIFGLQVGGGFDRDQMAFDYAKPFHKKPIISCGLILDKGQTPIVKIMPL